MRILYTTTIGLTMIFFKSFVKQLIDEGNTVDIATNEETYQVDSCYREWGCNIYQMSWTRSPISTGNIKAIKELKQIIKDGYYDIVHCHTPIAAACTRLACKSFRKRGLKVIYTAHGFHFYKGAPIKNWIIFFSLERICSKWTDVLITINKEDYAIAQKRMKAKHVEYLPGVGIDVEKFKDTDIDKNKKRREIGVSGDDFLILSVGELNANKNHQIVIRAIAEIGDDNMHYAIAGKGDQKETLEKLAFDLGVSKRIHCLGYRNDVAELYKAADVYVLPSIREGLNVSVMEALASGLPCIVSKIRGNVDMVQDGVNGFYIDPFDVRTVVNSITKTVNGKKKDKIAESAEKFNSNEINNHLMRIYTRIDV